MDSLDDFGSTWTFLLNHDPIADGALIQDLGRAGFCRDVVASNLSSFKRMTLNDLIELAVLEHGDDSPAMFLLKTLSSEDALEAAQSLVRKPNPARRIVGIRMLSGKVGVVFNRQAVKVMRTLVKAERDELVLVDIVCSMHSLKVAHRSLLLEPFIHLANSDVREAVAYSLTGERDDLAIRCLTKLSSDPVVAVRGWAVLGLGPMIEMDTCEIRSALYARSDDDDSEVKGDALIGLAMRGDQRVCSHIAKELNAQTVGVQAVEAASELGDPALLESLLALRTWWTVDPHLLDEAIERCSNMRA